MKLLVLLICLGYAMASTELLEELDRILSSKEKSADPAAVQDQADKVMMDLVKSLSEEDHKHEKKRKRVTSPLFDILMSRTNKRMFDDVDPTDEPETDYGYCMDGRTKATGPNQAGCDNELCYDVRTGTCNDLFKEELKMTDPEKREKSVRYKCAKNYAVTRMLCRYTCSYCKPRSPQKQCEDNYGHTPYGCCIVGNVPAMRADKSDCLKCRDIYPHACGQFKTSRFGVTCSSNSYRIRTFLERSCAVTCERCKYGEQ